MRSVCGVSLANLILSQDICAHIKEQDTRGVFRKYGIGNASRFPRIEPYRASGGRGPPFDYDRRLQVVQIHSKLPVQDRSTFNSHRIWCVAVLVVVSGVSRRSLTVGNA